VDPQLPHIEFAREPDRVPERRQGAGWGAPRSRPASRGEHGATLALQFTEVGQQTVQTRQILGIAPDRLRVFELSSDLPSARDLIEERLNAFIVDERTLVEEGSTVFRLTVQFEDNDAIQAFERELLSYRQESGVYDVLPPGRRNELFDSVRSIGNLSRSDRTGGRLKRHGWPAERVSYFDVDLWHPGDPQAARQVLDDLRQICHKFEGAVSDVVMTSSLLLAKIRGPVDLAMVLLDLDLVARVDLPPRLTTASELLVLGDYAQDTMPLPADDAPTVCVIDSGVVAGHPLLRGWVVEERDFDSGESTSVDLQGHGTAVAGLVVHGDIAAALERSDWNPRVQICSGKVLRRHPDGWPGAHFPEENRIERVFEEVIRYFHAERNCRIFNISVAVEDDLYDGGRQFPWAEKLDELARELDIVVVVLAGNRTDVPVPGSTATREQFQQQVRDNLLDPQQRLCNPATAALALTVGSLARTDAVAPETPERIGSRIPDSVAASPAGAPSPFTRTGPGYSIDGTKTMIKPDLVDFGGNWAMQTIAGGGARWVSSHVLLGEPAPRLMNPGDLRFIGAQSGTSFAAPHVAHASAVALSALEGAVEQEPSANLVRALVGSTARVPPCGLEWFECEDQRLRSIGYGLPNESDLEWSHPNRVFLLAMDQVPEGSLHLYRLPVPQSFLETQGMRGLAVSLAFDPPTRASRKEYLSRTMWFEVFQGLTLDEIEHYKGRFIGERPLPIPDWASISLRPTKTQRQWSTLQVGHKEWRQRPRWRLAAGDSEHGLHIIVGCQARFRSGMSALQRYGLVVQLWHESTDATIYEHIRATVRTRVPRVRIPLQG
jgi:hypothetical protein